MAQVANINSGLFQKGVGPYLERSDHKPRQTSVSRLRQTVASFFQVFLNLITYFQELKYEPPTNHFEPVLLGAVDPPVGGLL